jgi:predicted phosphodiesterase
MKVAPMKYAVLGDIHANLEALEAVLQDAQSRACNRFACVGDLVGYNANPRECLAIVRDLNMVCVRGNHDEYAAGDLTLERWNLRAASAIAWTRTRLSDDDCAWLRNLRYVRIHAGFTVVHATLDSPEDWGYVLDHLTASSSFRYQVTPVCFYGHTHLPVVFRRDEPPGKNFTRLELQAGRQYLINVGSVGEPRDGLAMASYVTYEPDEGVVELHRVPYDQERTDAKLTAHGLYLRRKRRPPQEPSPPPAGGDGSSAEGGSGDGQTSNNWT